MNLKSYLVLISALALVFIALYISRPVPEASAESYAYSDKEALVERGKYLVSIIGCQDCHSPKVMTPQGPQPDPAKALSGHPANEPIPEIPDGIIKPGGWMGLLNQHLTAALGPWGVSYSANLTPDDETGIGTWTLDMFKGSLRTGRHMGEGRMILPPMPWYNFAKMTDEDIEAMYMYLQSIPPVRNPVPEPIPAEEIGFPPFPPEGM